MIIRDYFFTSLDDDCSFADVREIFSGRDLRVGDAVVRHQRSPRVKSNLSMLKLNLNKKLIQMQIVSCLFSCKSVLLSVSGSYNLNYFLGVKSKLKLNRKLHLIKIVCCLLKKMQLYIYLDAKHGLLIRIVIFKSVFQISLCKFCNLHYPNDVTFQ